MSADMQHMLWVPAVHCTIRLPKRQFTGHTPSIGIFLVLVDGSSDTEQCFSQHYWWNTALVRRGLVTNSPGGPSRAEITQLPDDGHTGRWRDRSGSDGSCTAISLPPLCHWNFHRQRFLPEINADRTVLIEDTARSLALFFTFAKAEVMRLVRFVSLVLSVCRITAKVSSPFHWNLVLSSSLLTFGDDLNPDTDSGLLFHFPQHCRI